MKPSKQAQQLITSEYFEKIIGICQQLLNGTSHLCVSKELNLSDIQIIGEVVLQDLESRNNIDNPTLRRAITHRAEGMFKQWIKKQEKKDAPL